MRISLDRVEAEHYISNALHRDGKQYSLKNIGTGNIERSSDGDGMVLIIDGKEISFEEFGNLCSAYEGFKLEYQFRDAYDKGMGKNIALKKVDITSDAVLNRFCKNLKWFTEDMVLEEKDFKEFGKAIEESIDDIALMIACGERDEVREVADIMISRLVEITCEDKSVIETLWKMIDDEIWFLE